VFLLNALIHIKDALDSLFPEDSSESNEEFLPALMALPARLSEELRETNQPAYPYPDAQLSRKRTKVLKEHLGDCGGVLVFIERCAMWRSTAEGLKKDPDRAEDTAPKPNLRAMFLSTKKKVASATIKSNMVLAACALRLGYSGENKMRGDNETQPLTQDELLPLDIAASIGVNSLISKLGYTKQITVDDAFNVCLRMYPLNIT